MTPCPARGWWVSVSPARDRPVTQDPYDRTIISDGLRRAMGVPDQAGQEQQRQWFEAEARAARERRATRTPESQ